MPTSLLATPAVACFSTLYGSSGFFNQWHAAIHARTAVVSVPSTGQVDSSTPVTAGEWLPCARGFSTLYGSSGFFNLDSPDARHALSSSFQYPLRVKWILQPLAMIARFKSVSGFQYPLRVKWILQPCASGLYAGCAFRVSVPSTGQVDSSTGRGTPASSRAGRVSVPSTGQVDSSTCGLSSPGITTYPVSVPSTGQVDSSTGRQHPLRATPPSGFSTLYGSSGFFNVPSVTEVPKAVQVSVPSTGQVDSSTLLCQRSPILPIGVSVPSTGQVDSSTRTANPHHSTSIKFQYPLRVKWILQLGEI